jgi:hypothetical protein
MNSKLIRCFVFLVALFISSNASSEDLDESSIKYMCFLGMKSQIDFFRDYCKGDDKHIALIDEAEKQFIRNNPLYSQIGNSPPKNAKSLELENQKIQSSAQPFMIRDLSKLPDEAVCMNFAEQLRNTSFESLIEDSMKRFEQYKEERKIP